jgi:trimeric autotransporter adhesin
MLLNEFTSPQQIDELDIRAKYNAAKQGLAKAADVTKGVYGDVKQGVKTLGQATKSVYGDVKGATQAVGQAAGTVAKDLGKGVATVAGGTAKGLGAVAGGATTGLGRAAVKGFNKGVQAVGGAPATRPQTNVFKQAPAATAATAVPAQPGASTGQASVYSTITNPETGKLYTKAELRSKYGQVAAPAKAAPVSATPSLDAYTTKELKRNIDTTIAALSRLPAKSKQSVVKHAQDALTKAVSTPTWTGRGAKVSTPPSAGSPTAAERAKLDQKIQQAMAKQPVSETAMQRLTTLSWSRDFDPSASLLRKIQ